MTAPVAVQTLFEIGVPGKEPFVSKRVFPRLHPSDATEKTP